MAKSKNRPITVDDLWAMRHIGPPSVSPDGDYACAAVTRYNIERNDSATQIRIFRTHQGARSNRARVLAHGDKDSEVQWSPDGQWIAFTARRDGDRVPQIYLVAPGGGRPRRLTRLSTGAGGLRWFPDASRIAFISWVWPELDGDGAQARRLRELQRSKVKARVSERVSYRYWDHWLTDGRVPHVFAVDVSGGKTRDLFAGTGVSLPLLEPGAQLYDIRPDGKELALTVDLDPEPKWGNKLDIATVPIEKAKRATRYKNLTAASRRSSSEPRYAPDGNSLVYLSSNFQRSFDDQPRLIVRDRASGRSRVVAPNWDRSPANVAWLPDGSGLLFTAEDRGRQGLWRLRLGEHAPSQLVAGGTISAFALSRHARRIVFNGSTTCAPPGLFAIGIDDGEVRAIETLNRASMARLNLGAVREAAISGWGGETVQMWLTYPPNFDKKKRWPLLHLLHGGPHTAWLDMFHTRWNAQVFAAQGYVVASVNYHGSSGWGRRFLEADNGRYGEKELADIEAATDYLLQRGYIDRRRLFAAGGSYGGYLAAFMNGRTRRYRAYVAHAACFDWVSMMATDAYLHLKHELGAFAWDDATRVLRQSPHHYAKNFHTPTLITHGELDYRVPVAQALQHYATLKARGVPARLLIFPDENHWILKPQNARLWTRELLAWLRRHDARSRIRRRDER